MVHFADGSRHIANGIELKKSTMVIEQIYTGCLAQGAYYIESEGFAMIIDPLRNAKTYGRESGQEWRENHAHS